MEVANGISLSDEVVCAGKAHTDITAPSSSDAPTDGGTVDNLS